MSSTELIANARTLHRHSSVTVPEHAAMILELADALEAAEREMHMRELHHFESEEALAAAQAQIERALEACDPSKGEGAGLDVVRRILAQSPTDALQAHDRQVAAKAVDAALSHVQELRGGDIEQEYLDAARAAAIRAQLTGGEANE